VSATRIIGHRGDPESALENTEAAFRAALDAGAQIIETDVRLTTDGHIVVAHDPDFSRFGGPAIPIRRCTRSDLQALPLVDDRGYRGTPLFFDEALERFPGIRFNVDLKDPGASIVRAWCALLDRHDAWPRCRTASFRDRSLRQFRRLAPGAPVSLGRFAVLTLLASGYLGGPRRPRPGEGVVQVPEKAGPIRIVTPRRIDLWRRRGWKTQVWTVDNEDDMVRLVSWGVDGIITNRPSLLQRILN